MTQKELVQKLQLALGITPDGDFGPVTQSTSLKFDIDIIATEKEADTKPVKPAPTNVMSNDYFGATWIGVYQPYLGMAETNPKLMAALVPGWPRSDCPGIHDLEGRDHAWCMLLGNESYHAVGLPGTGSGLASSGRRYGVMADDYWFGTGLGIRHKDGGGHWTFFLYWINKAARIAACYGGNQDSHLCIKAYNLSGNAADHDEVINGPRWPAGWPKGQVVSKEDVLAKYPNLKVSGTGGSTR